MHIDLGYGHVFRGTPMEIIAQMKAVAEGVDDLDLGDYMDWVIERAAVQGVLLFVLSGPLHTRAESLLREMIATDLARDLDEQGDAEDERSTGRWIAAQEIASLHA